MLTGMQSRINRQLMVEQSLASVTLTNRSLELLIGWILSFSRYSSANPSIADRNEFQIVLRDSSPIEMPLDDEVDVGLVGVTTNEHLLDLRSILTERFGRAGIITIITSTRANEPSSIT